MSSSTLKTAGAMIVTVVSAVILIGWLVIVADKIGVAPKLDDKGNVILDEWGRAKDILLVIVPLFTAAAGYWLGNKDTAAANQKVEEANKKVALLSGALDSSTLDNLHAKYSNLF